MTTPAATTPVQLLRRMTAEYGDEFYTDGQMQEFLDRSTENSITNMDKAALLVWLEKMARYATMTDVVESGAERKLSQLYKNAVSQVELYSRFVETAIDRVAENYRVPGRSSTVWGGVPNRDPVHYGPSSTRA